MIVEFLITILTPLAIYNILKVFNVPRYIAVVISLIYTLLLIAAFTWIILIYGVLTLVVIALIIRRASRGQSRRFVQRTRKFR